MGTLLLLAPSSADWYNGTTGRTPIERLSFLYTEVLGVFSRVRGERRCNLDRQENQIMVQGRIGPT
jgi:hypothetical protein